MGGPAGSRAAELEGSAVINSRVSWSTGDPPQRTSKLPTRRGSSQPERWSRPSATFRRPGGPVPAGRRARRRSTATPATSSVDEGHAPPADERLRWTDVAQAVGGRRRRRERRHGWSSCAPASCSTTTPRRSTGWRRRSWDWAAASRRGDQWVSWIHIDDWLRASSASCLRPDPPLDRGRARHSRAPGAERATSMAAFRKSAPVRRRLPRRSLVRVGALLLSDRTRAGPHRPPRDPSRLHRRGLRLPPPRPRRSPGRPKARQQPRPERHGMPYAPISGERRMLRRGCASTTATSIAGEYDARGKGAVA